LLTNNLQNDIAHKSTENVIARKQFYKISLILFKDAILL